MDVDVRTYIDILIIIITFPYSTCISSFLAAAALLLCSYLLEGAALGVLGNILFQFC